MRKWLRVLPWLVVMLLLCSPALADRIADLWVSSDGLKGDDAISWYKGRDGYYLFLPGNCSLEDFKIGFDGVDHVMLGDKTILPGDNLMAFALNEANRIVNDKHKYDLHIIQGSRIPALYITTESGKLDTIHHRKTNKEAGTLLLVNQYGYPEYNGALTYIKIRGNASARFSRKNYQLKLENGTNLLGMGKCRTWIVTSNSSDKTLLRNQITLDMAMYVGLDYTPEHQMVEVYINQDYMGAYLFSEKVMVDDDRVAIRNLEELTEDMNENELDTFAIAGSKKGSAGKWKAYDIPNQPADITGGYLIEYESVPHYKQETSVYWTNRDSMLVIKSPEYCTQEQMDYISSFMQRFENAIFSEDGVDAESGMHYSELVDFQSLVNKYLIEEVVKNYDGNKRSMFFYKPADEQSPVAFAGPVWDYDSSYGRYAQEHNARKVLPGKGFWINNATGRKYWWPALYRQEDFQQAAVQRYAEAFSPAIEILLGLRTDESETLLSIDDYVRQIEQTATMNFTRFPIPKNTSAVAKTGWTFEENIDYLKNFLEKRYAFLSEQWMGE